ncbi:hypothetical protein SLNSH_09465 [Alsobacter soli]|uniref:Uncharacterized protein n=2 Tax=Alsobacter soli TaxID=2109933 RepID=A0A2T1HUU5_9HYPH|nr:hypothetical protein SLNSH_09465 [Alsobacter soli]
MRVVGPLIDALVLPFVLFDELVRPLYRPLIRLLARLKLMQWLEQAVCALPPYGVLVAFLVPFVIFEPLKILGLYWLGTGHARLAVPTLIVSHGATFLLVERLYDAGRPKLMTIGWFAPIARLVERVRDAAMAWLRSRPAWMAIKAYAKRVRAHVAGFFAKLRARSPG